MSTIIDGEYKVTTLPSGTVIREINSAPLVPPLYLPMLPFDFLNRLLQTERVAILTLAQTDMNAADFNNMLNHAPSVMLNDQRLIDGVNYCASKIPAITAARVAAILDPTK